MKTYTVDVYRPGNVDAVIKQLELGGAKWIDSIPAPFFNIWGERIGQQYIVVYQSENEIPCEVQN